MRRMPANSRIISGNSQKFAPVWPRFFGPAREIYPSSKAVSMAQKKLGEPMRSTQDACIAWKNTSSPAESSYKLLTCVGDGKTCNPERQADAAAAFLASPILGEAWVQLVLTGDFRNVSFSVALFIIAGVEKSILNSAGLALKLAWNKIQVIKKPARQQRRASSAS
jgi:hypothetical protein